MGDSGRLGCGLKAYIEDALAKHTLLNGYNSGVASEPRMTQSNEVQFSITKLPEGRWDYSWVAPPLASEIHIWEFRSEVADWPSRQVGSVLSAEEKERASRFHFQRDTQRFSVTRARMRSILGMYVQSDPRELRFVYTGHGKPSLGDKGADIQFNVSHSGDLAVLAVATGREVGVDIEQVRNNVECEQLAERFFSPGERGMMRELPDHEKLTFFFRLWTCKEAFLKAHGTGLSRSLSSFEIRPGTAPGQILKIKGEGAAEKRWSLIELEAPNGYASAAVADGELGTARVFRLE